MDLTSNSTPAREHLYGEEAIVATAGMRVTIETSPGGADVLDVVVPAGKTWNVKFVVSIDETPP